MKSLLSLTLCTFISASAIAGYQVIGSVKAEDCYNFGVKICSIKTVTEVRKDGRRFEISNYFERVSDYNSSSQMCYIKTKSTDWGLLSYGINALTQPDFWGVDKEGKLGKIDADYIYFKCAKV